MKRLKGVIFSLRDVMVMQGPLDQDIVGQLVKLFRYLKSREVEPVLVGNSRWVFTGKKETLFSDWLSEKVGFEIKTFVKGYGGMPAKQRSEGMRFVRDACGWEEHEAIYVGSTQDDVQAASNGSLMFLNAKWHADNSPYGFEFESPIDIARFVDCCCLSMGDWFWAYEDGDLRVYAIAPLAEYSRRYPHGAGYSTAAKQAVKLDYGDLPFWGRLMAARLYFSGLAGEANHVAPYPGHSVNSKKRLLNRSLQIIGGSMRASYLEDLIVRHTDAPKSQHLRTSGRSPNHDSQLSTIHLRRDPLRTGPQGRRYKTPPLKTEKTVLVFDDICTEGYSFEAARAFVEATGARAICVAWLKTPGPNHYQKAESFWPAVDKPYQPSSAGIATTKTLSNDGGVRNARAAEELSAAVSRYTNWQWPSGL
ncbi:phosphoribosyltransferase [Haloferula sargassicola]|uniref:Phosphoribosyltransferase n=1 Tax=Haloferula sargassicola TaxID=490096 RepID=A0ABP9UUE6_9BACT